VSDQVVTARGGNVTGGYARLYATPTSHQVQRASINQTLLWRSLGSTRLDPSGRFALTIPVRSALSGFVDSSGVVNFHVIVQTAQGTGETSFSRHYGSSSEPALSMDTPAAAISPVVMSHQAVAGSVAPGPLDDPSSCSSTYIARYSFNTNIGSTYVNTTGVSATVTYVNGTSSSLGVGSSASGAYGTFSAAGTSSVSHSTETDYPTMTNRQSYRYTTYMRYDKHKDVCRDSRTGAIILTSYDVSGTSQDGGAEYAGIGLAKFSHCRTYLKGTGQVKNSGTSYDFTAGVAAGSAIGMSLSSQTGWNHSATETLKGNHQFHICGQFDFPAAGGSGGIEATG